MELKDELELIKEEQVIKNEQLLKYERITDQLQDEVTLHSLLICIVEILQGIEQRLVETTGRV